MEGIYYITTPIGTFRVVKSTHTEVRKEMKRVWSVLKIGDQQATYMELKWYDNEENVEMQWLEVEQGWCEFADIDTVFLYVSITLLRKYHPTVKKLWFMDDSNIKCTLPLQENQQTPITQTMSLQKLYFLTKQSTWYEAMFGAYPLHEDQYSTYMNYKQHFTDPTKKPLFFDFGNGDLQKYYNPVYDTTDTWAEFMEAIGEQPCNCFIPWYIRALSEISERKIILPNYWQIDINENTPIVKIDIYTERECDKRNTFRKQRQIQHTEYPMLSPFRLSEIRYPSLL